MLKQACSVPRRSASPVASNFSDSGFRTENLSEELPLLITSMSEEEVGTVDRLAELDCRSQSQGKGEPALLSDLSLFLAKRPWN